MTLRATRPVLNDAVDQIALEWKRVGEVEVLQLVDEALDQISLAAEEWADSLLTTEPTSGLHDPAAWLEEQKR